MRMATEGFNKMRGGKEAKKKILGGVRLKLPRVYAKA